MNLPQTKYKKASVGLSIFLLLSFLSLSITERSASPPYEFIALSLVFLISGIKLDERKNMYLFVVVLTGMFINWVYLYVTYKEGA